VFNVVDFVIHALHNYIIEFASRCPQTVLRVFKHISKADGFTGRVAITLRNFLPTKLGRGDITEKLQKVWQ